MNGDITDTKALALASLAPGGETVATPLGIGKGLF